MAGIPFFPPDNFTRLKISAEMNSMCRNGAELAWLADTAWTHMRTWKGIPELRGLFCTRFRPRDGIEAECSIGGFQPADLEAAYSLAPPPTPAALLAEYAPLVITSGEPEQDPLLPTTRRVPEAKRLAYSNGAKESEPPELRRISEGFPTPAEKPSVKTLERQIEAASPTLTVTEKLRRIQEIQTALGVRE